MQRGVCVVSVGVCACSGNTPQSALECALGKTRDFFAPVSSFESPRHSAKMVGYARPASDFGGKLLPHCAKILFSALDGALAGLDFSEVDSARKSLYLGTSIGGVFESENMLARNMASPENASWGELKFYECSALSELAAKRYGFGGECAAYSTACSSSYVALADACNAIVQGDCDVAAVCGADALSRITLNGFGSLLLLSQSRARPFDKLRDGINLGEAAAVLILASERFAEKISHKKPLACVSGWACTADAYHATAPHPQGEGAARAMKNALSFAGIAPEKISYYNAHGTGTKGNDTAEYAAMESVFGAGGVPYSSIKRAFGHTLGASGALNAAVSVSAMNAGVLVPNLGYSDGGGEFARAPITESSRAELENVLSVSLGFGGNNAAAVFLKQSVRHSARKGRLFVYSAAEVAPFASGGQTVGLPDLLPNVPALKKRRWAKLQQMVLDCAERSLDGFDISNAEKIGVCFGTGAGMVSETRRFIEATISKREAEPIPSAFTNSVHNAAASAVSLRFGLKGLNSAVSAKEISFEAALKQAWRAVNSGALDSAVVCAGDEYSDLAEKFVGQNAVFAKPAKPLTDYACAYFVGAENVGLSGGGAAKPLAEIKSLEVFRRKSARETAELLAGCARAYLSAPDNANLRAFADSVFALAGVGRVCDVSEHCGANYSASGAAFAAALRDGAGLAASVSLSSAGMCAVTVFEVL